MVKLGIGVSISIGGKPAVTVATWCPACSEVSRGEHKTCPKCLEPIPEKPNP